MRKLLLAIGLNYANSEYALPDCALDAQRMKALYEDHGYDSSVWTKMTPNQFEKIIKEIRDMKLDELVVYYSGHGVQLPKADSNEDDRYEEALCLWNGERLLMLTDHDFAALVSTAAKRVIVIMDCCHSGGMNRSMVQPGHKRKSLPYNASMVKFGIQEEFATKSKKDVTFLFASVENQVSYSTGDGGAFTNAFLQAVRNDMTKTSEIIDRIRRQVNFQRANFVGDGEKPVISNEMTIEERLLKYGKAKIPNVGEIRTWGWGGKSFASLRTLKSFREKLDS